MRIDGRSSSERAAGLRALWPSADVAEWRCSRVAILLELS